MLIRVPSSSKGNERCPTQALKNLETNFAGGTLSLNSLFTTFAKLINPDPSLEKTVLCTNCNKESYNIARKEIPGYLSQAGDVDKELSAKCGASFIGECSMGTYSQHGTHAVIPRWPDTPINQANCWAQRQFKDRHCNATFILRCAERRSDSTLRRCRGVHVLRMTFRRTTS